MDVRSLLSGAGWPGVTAVILLTISMTEAQRGEGDLCSLKYGGSGVCLHISSCPSAIRMVREGVVPDICGFRGSTAIVCCEDDSASNQLVAGSPPPRKPQRQPTLPSSSINEGSSSQFGGRPAQGGRIPPFQATQPPHQETKSPRPPVSHSTGNNNFPATGNFRPENQYRPEAVGTSTQYKPENNRPNTQYKPESNRPNTQYKPENNRPNTQYKPENNRPNTQHKPENNRPNTQYKPENNRPNTQYKPENNRPNTQYRPENNRPNTQYRPENNRPNTQYRPENNRPTNNRPGSEYQPPTTQQFGNIQSQHGRKRISEEKCEEYTRSVTEKVEALPLLPNPDPVTIQVKKCDFEKLPLIVGGEKTVVGEFPHMAAIGYQDNGGLAWNCGGSLISEYYVLTAAHCTHSGKGPPVMVRLGELNLKRDDDGAHPVDYPIENIVRHPEYKPPSKYNDIALLRLSDRVYFNKFLRPACLYTHESFSVNKTVATGWGRIDYAERPSEILLKVVLDIIDNNVCNNLWQSSVKLSSLPHGIAPSMMCAGVLTGGKDTCQGDSGGPIQISSRRNQCIYYVIGVTSFGKFCAAKNAPGVYTRISYFIPWIENIVWPDG